MLLGVAAVLIYTLIFVATMRHENTSCITFKPVDNCQILAFCHGPCSAGPKKPSCDRNMEVCSLDPACRKNCACKKICS
ncbi:hypothetical protein GGR51DRAFT_98168 [Nemania sp. FL0031]|nr:hypothetical protein GGR51DRAFT_98168 [Nemania sp. FL0031]